MKIFFTSVTTFIVCVVTMLSAIADDIDVYKFTTNKPQVLMIIDNSGSMNCFAGEHSSRCKYGKPRANTKIDIARKAIDKILVKNTDIDYGIMRYHDNNNAVTKERVSSKRMIHFIKGTDATRLQEIRGNVKKIRANDSRGNSYATPLCTTYKDAKNYFLSSLNGRKAPLLSCSKSNILYLSDGAPYEDMSIDNCRTDATALFNKKIRTYTIGFAQDIDILKTMASNGGGKYFRASGQDLAIKLQSAMDEIKNVSSTIQTASTTSSSDQFSHGNLVYLNGFSASNKPRWKGNVKKFYMKNGKMYENSGRTVLARNSDGTLKTDIMKGGLGADLLKYTNYFQQRNSHSSVVRSMRKIFTNEGNKLIRNPDRFKSLMGINGDEQNWLYGRRDKDWPLGDILHSKPVTIQYGPDPTTNVTFFGTNEGFLHAFHNMNAIGSGVANPELWAFYPKELGGELIKIIRKNHAKRGDIAKHLYGVDGQIFVYTKDANNDGKLSYRSRNRSTGDKAIIFFGLRRGGQYYYAVNVLDKNNPQLLWKYKLPSNGQSWSVPKITYLHNSKGKKTLSMIVAGGYDTNKDTNATNDKNGKGIYAINVSTGKELWRLNASSPMGGSFSHSMPATVSALDSNSDGITDRLYVGDTGGNIWRVDIVPDSKNNNKVSKSTNPNEITVFKIAALGGKGVNDRRIFNKIDIVRTFYNGRKVDYLLVGTGTQPSPLERTVKNRFYAIMDFRTNTQLVTKQDLVNFPIKNSQLANMTSHLGKAKANDKVRETTFTNKNGIETARNVGGWYLSLNNAGEKAWHSSVTFSGKIGFLTYTPGLNTGGNQCSAGNIGEASLYAVDLRTGRSVFNVNGGTFKPKLNQTLNSSDRKIKYGSGIPGKISLHIRTNSSKKQFVSLLSPRGEIKIPILGDSNKSAKELKESRRRNNRSYILSGDAN
jgi:Tfp pilus tip-associated adhesin PilY1